MRGSLVALLACLCQQATAQRFAAMPDSTDRSGPKITLSFRGLPLKIALEKMAKAVGYTLVCAPSDLENKTLDLNVQDAYLGKVLHERLSPQGLDFVFTADSQICIRRIPPVSRQPMEVDGRVTDDGGLTLANITITVKGRSKSTQTDDKGRFKITGIGNGDKLLLTSVNTESREILVTAGDTLHIVLQTAVKPLSAVLVTPHNGIQDANPGLATGASITLNRHQLDRSPSGDVDYRMLGFIPGLLSDPHTGNSSGLTIRGQNTIFANPEPLRVLDNFEFYGNYIDPESLESITVLKDAVAASIWGPRSGNGVIVYTTKKGKYNCPARLHFSCNMVFSGKPDLFYPPRLSSRDYIGMEKQLFSAGNFDESLTDPSYPSVTPAVDILNDLRAGTLNQTTANAMLDSLARHDVRSDLLRYRYRNSLDRRYHLDLSGGGACHRFFLSAGYETDALDLQANSQDRLSLHATNSYSLFGHALEFTSTIHYTHAMDKGNDPGLDPFYYPYARLADPQGRALPVNYGHRMGYIDTAGAGLLQDWRYYPLDEYRLTDDRTSLNDYQLQAELRFRIWKGLSADMVYQYSRGQSRRRNYHSPASYFVRDLRNMFTQPGGGSAISPLPYGGIMDDRDSGFIAHNGRAELSYMDSSADKRHLWSILAGGEIKDFVMEDHSQRLYGYDPESGSSLPVDLVNVYPTYIGNDVLAIPSGLSQQSNTNRFVAIFMNASYVYRKLYSFYASARKDAANLVGVYTNRNWEPFWSLGASREFRRTRRDPFRLRLSYGCNGNVANTSGFLLITPLGVNAHGVAESGIERPPDPQLGWEKTYIWNAGLDHTLIKDHFLGSLDLFRKNGVGLLGNASLPPSSGVTNFLGNTAGLKGKGMELSLNAFFKIGKLQNTMGLIFNDVTDRVSAYGYRPPANQGYIVGGIPFPGKPVSAIFSFAWAGLDHNLGNPQGLIKGNPSTDYPSLLASADPSVRLYNGPGQPPIYGSFTDELSWQGWTFSWLILYKMGYYFRRESINYVATFQGNDSGHPDYDIRWQIPGDEKRTDVPSLVYPGDQQRDLFYQYSRVLVTKGDHIRLQSLKLNYEVPSRKGKKSPFRDLNIYAAADNLGILWRANRFHLDPDVVDSRAWPAVRSFTLGLRADLKTTKNEKERIPVDLPQSSVLL